VALVSTAVSTAGRPVTAGTGPQNLVNALRRRDRPLSADLGSCQTPAYGTASRISTVAARPFGKL
jgi:hypothetical protein